MSIYTRCMEAAEALLEDPSLAGGDPPGLFTELDVITHASASDGPWTNERYRFAMREVNQVMGLLFREGRAVRFGPVQIPDVPEPDYLRIASKIVYAHPRGPERVETPNGTFERLIATNGKDPLAKQGRRLGTNRDDLQPWDQQDIKTARKTQRRPSNVQAANRRIRELEAEVNRLRSNSADHTEGTLREEVRAVVSEIRERIDRLEEVAQAI